MTFIPYHPFRVNILQNRLRHFVLEQMPLVLKALHHTEMVRRFHIQAADDDGGIIVRVRVFEVVEKIRPVGVLSVSFTYSRGTLRRMRTAPETRPPVFCFLPRTTPNMGHLAVQVEHIDERGVLLLKRNTGACAVNLAALQKYASRRRTDMCQ